MISMGTHGPALAVSIVSEISYDDLLEGDLLDELSDIGQDEEGENDDLTKMEFAGMFG